MFSSLLLLCSFFIKRRADGSLYRDPNVEFDSDEEEGPPEPPPNLNIPMKPTLAVVQHPRDEEQKADEEEKEGKKRKKDP